MRSENVMAAVLILGLRMGACVNQGVVMNVRVTALGIFQMIVPGTMALVTIFQVLVGELDARIEETTTAVIITAKLVGVRLVVVGLVRIPAPQLAGLMAVVPIVVEMVRKQPLIAA